MPHGCITRIEPDLGFGWIVDDAGTEWFFVREGFRDGAIEKVLESERVTFSIEWTPNGPRATDIALDYPEPVR